MDIQRGDQVYYRGEVWTVRATGSWPDGKKALSLGRLNGSKRYEHAIAPSNQVQRVEQVR